MDFKRLTVERVKAAYEKTGIKPVQGVYRSYDDNGVVCGGCAITAVLMAEMPEIKFDTADFGSAFEKHMHSPPGYLAGILNGFDARITPSSGPNYNNGYEDGRACRAAVFEEQPTTEEAATDDLPAQDRP